MPDTSVKLQDITPVKSTFDSDDQLLLIGPEGEARISKEDFLDAMPDDAITLIGDITTTGIEGNTVAKQLGALKNSKAAAITDTASGAIANFPDGADDMPVTSLVADIDLVQDLTYGDPYPVGGGVNKLDPAEVTVFGSAYGFTLVWNANVGSLNINGTYTGSSSTAEFRAINVPSAVRSLNVKGFSSSSNFSSVRWQSGDNQIVVSLTGLTQNSSYNITVYPIVYEGSTAPASWTPYSNICPITGWTGCNVTRTGKNLFNQALFDTGVGQNITYTHYAIPNGTYTMSTSMPMVNSLTNVFVIAGSVSSGASSSTNGVSSSSPRTITVTDGYYTVAYRSTNDQNTNNPKNFNWQLELGSSATTYEPYQGNKVTVDWTTEAGTVFGGTIDVTTGLLTVTHALFDMGNATIFTEDTNRPGVFIFAIPGRPLSSDITACSAYLVNNVSVTTNVDNYISGFYSYGGNSVFFRDTSMAGYTSAQVKAAVSGYMLTYELATPQTYQLSGQQLMTLLGTNNVWTDIANVTVKYPADTKMYIDNAIAALA